MAIVLIALCCQTIYGRQWQSAIVHFDTLGRLVYVPDGDGNRIPDFSYAGYKNGEATIPTVPVVSTISPVPGDNTVNIQNAVNQVGALTPDVNGIRGAVLLDPGVYRVSGTVQVNFDGVVLRGSGQGADSTTNTIILGTGNTPIDRDVVVVGGGSNTRWSGKVSGTQTNITDDTVYVGSRSFHVENAAPYAVGDNIIIYHPCTDPWLQAVDYGGTNGAELWTVGSQPLVFNRFIKEINGNTITVDAPVYNTLVKALSQSYIYKYNRSGLKRYAGIENLRVDITGWEPDTLNVSSSAATAIAFSQIEDGWALSCTGLHFSYAALRTETATRITVDSCNALNPIGTVDPNDPNHRRYSFALDDASQQVLMQNCYSERGRHSFMSNGTSWVSGCVFYNDKVFNAFAPSEPHRRWSMGILYDNFKQLNGKLPGYSSYLLGLYNRGDMGTGHGWAAAHSVTWNCDVAGTGLVIQKPPTAQNYAIGCFGNVTGAKPPAPFVQPAGYIEGSNQPNLNPPSLYVEQLRERLGGHYTIQNGNWSSPSTWNGGVVPSSGTNVVISAGDTVNIDISYAQCGDIVIDGVLLFPNDAPGKGITIFGTLTIDTNGIFRTTARSSSGQALVHAITLYGGLFNNGGTFDMRAGSGTDTSANTVGAANLIFTGSEISRVQVGVYSSSNNEFNAIRFDKSGGARVILQSNVSGNTSSSVAGSFFTFANGIVETGNDTLISLATSSGSIIGGSPSSYVIGNLGRAKSSVPGQLFFPIGDEAGYRPLTVFTSTSGMTTKHYLSARVVHGNANTGSSVLLGGIQSVSPVRYCEVTYTQGSSSSPSMTFYKFTPSYGIDDSAVAGMQNVRVVTSSDNRATWIARGPENHTVNVDAPPTPISSDSLNLAEQIVLADKESFCIALGKTSGDSLIAPGLVSPADGGTFTTIALSFLWHRANAGDIGYWFEYATDSVFSSPIIDSTLLDTVTLLSNLPCSQTYWWRVRARYLAGWGPFSAARRFRVDFVQHMSYTAGWNMLSLPVDGNGLPVHTVFPTALSQGFSYGGVYVPTDTLRSGIGYWVKLPAPTLADFHGYEFLSDTVSLSAGWNLIGSLSEFARVNAIGSIPPGLILSPFFGFNGSSYYIVDSLRPGSAYWVKSSSPGTLILSAQAMQVAGKRVTIISTGEAPPAPPDAQSPGNQIPTDYQLAQNSPNPFNPSTEIRYAIPTGGRVTVTVYDVLGRIVAVLVDEVQQPGEYLVTWDAANAPSGVYFYRCQSGTFTALKKMVVLK